MNKSQGSADSLLGDSLNRSIKEERPVHPKINEGAKNETFGAGKEKSGNILPGLLKHYENREDIYARPPPSYERREKIGIIMQNDKNNYKNYKDYKEKNKIYDPYLQYKDSIESLTDLNEKYLKQTSQSSIMEIVDLKHQDTRTCGSLRSNVSEPNEPSMRKDKIEPKERSRTSGLQGTEKDSSNSETVRIMKLSEDCKKQGENLLSELKQFNSKNITPGDSSQVQWNQEKGYYVDKENDEKPAIEEKNEKHQRSTSTIVEEEKILTALQSRKRTEVQTQTQSLTQSPQKKEEAQIQTEENTQNQEKTETPKKEQPAQAQVNYYFK